MNRRLIINCAALSRAMVERPGAMLATAALAARGQMVDLEPSFPALTCSVQATLTTGQLPAVHGIVGNGFYQAELAETRFWEQPATLVGAPPAWTKLAARPGGKKVAMLFWQNSLYADVECMLTPKPLHTETGLVNDCYSRPEGLYAALVAKLGEFPLMRYWGPMAGIDSSKWIAAATEEVWRTQRPDLCLTYLPHLDYNTQRRGPDPAGLAEDLKEVDALVGRLAAMAAADGAEVVVLSEYSLTAVTRAVAINRVLREAGLLAVRELAGREYLDCGACGAFAVADHQIAHVYLPRNREANLGRVKKLLQGTPGVAEVLDAKEQTSRGIRHARSGDLIAVAEADAWFSYYYWLDEARAPDFARTVDIHRKPGYDPVELFFDPATRSIPLNAELVRGSHGRAGAGEAKGVLICSASRNELASRKSLRADEFATIFLV